MLTRVARHSLLLCDGPGCIETAKATGGLPPGWFEIKVEIVLGERLVEVPHAESRPTVVLHSRKCAYGWWQSVMANLAKAGVPEV